VAVRAQSWWRSWLAAGKRLDLALAALGMALDARRLGVRAAQRWAAMVTSSQHAIIGETLDRIVTDFNPGAEALLGFKASEMIGRNMAELAPPGHPDPAPQAVRKGGEPLHEGILFADTDQRHVFSMSMNWEIDYYRGGSALLRNILNGWTIAPIIKLRSGLPFTITNGNVDANLDGNTNDRAQQVGDPHLDDPSSAMWFNTAAFVQNRVVTGVTWVGKELWHGTWEEEKSDLRRVDPQTGEVLELIEMPRGVGVSGLESNGGDLFFCGGGPSGMVRAVRKPKRQSKAVPVE